MNGLQKIFDKVFNTALNDSKKIFSGDEMEQSILDVINSSTPEICEDIISTLKKDSQALIKSNKANMDGFVKKNF